MAQTFRCPSCDAALDYTGEDDPVVRCAYCGSTVIVPEELRAHSHEQQISWTTTTLSPEAMTFDLGDMMGKVMQLKTVKQLVRDGQMAEAAQLFQEIFGTSAEEAQSVVQQLASGQSVMLSGDVTSTSIPVAFGTSVQVTSSPQVAEMLQGQLGAAQQVQRRIGRAFFWIFFLALVITLAIFALVYFILLK